MKKLLLSIAVVLMSINEPIAAIVRDDFNRASIGSNWTTIEGTSAISIKGDTSAWGSTAGNCGAFLNTVPAASSGKVSVVVDWETSPCRYICIALRVQETPTINAYFIGLGADNSTMLFFKNVNSSYETVLTRSYSYNKKDSITAYMRSDTVFCEVNGVLVDSAKDNANSFPSGRFGVLLFRDSDGGFINSFTFDDGASCDPVTGTNPSNRIDTVGQSGRFKITVSGTIDSLHILNKGALDSIALVATKDSVAWRAKDSATSVSVSIAIHSCGLAVATDTVNLTWTMVYPLVHLDSVRTPSGSAILYVNDSLYVHARNLPVNMACSSGTAAVPFIRTSSTLLKLKADTATTVKIGEDTLTVSNGITADTIYFEILTSADSTTITITATGDTVTTDPAAVNGKLQTGSTVVVTATPSPGYTFTAWAGALVDSPAVSPISWIVPSGSATIGATFNIIPTHISGPTSKTVVVSSNYIDTSHFTGAASFQWQTEFGYGGGVYWGDIDGATDSILTYGPVVLPESGYLFRCIGTNAYGGDTSGEATLTVVLSPVIDSIIKIGSQRDMSQRYAVRNGDSVMIYGIGFYSLGDSSKILQNSGGTLTMTILNWWEGSTKDSIRAIIAGGSPAAYYRTRIRNRYSIISSTPLTHNLRVKVPSTGNVRPW